MTEGRGSTGRSIAAVVLGFVAVFVLSLAADEVCHLLGAYPPWGAPFIDTKLCLLALSYRMVFTAAGGYITARFAPRNAMRHVWILGWIGLAFGVMGAVMGQMAQLGATWYGWAVAVSGLPCVLLGGWISERATRRLPFSGHTVSSK